MMLIELKVINTITLEMPIGNSICRYPLSDVQLSTYKNTSAITLANFDDFESNSSSQLVAKLKSDKYGNLTLNDDIVEWVVEEIVPNFTYTFRPITSNKYFLVLRQSNATV